MNFASSTKIPIAFCAALMISGCSAADQSRKELVMVPVVIDPTPIRCLERSSDEFKKWVKRPKPPLTDAQDSAWHDAQDAAIARKNAAGQSLEKDYEACRSGGKVT
jgi:hypothetical protein